MSEFEVSQSQSGVGVGNISVPNGSHGEGENRAPGFSSKELGMFKHDFEKPNQGIVSKNVGFEKKSSFARSHSLEEKSHKNTPLIDLNNHFDADLKSEDQKKENDKMPSHDEQLTRLFGEKYIIGDSPHNISQHEVRREFFERAPTSPSPSENQPDSHKEHYRESSTFSREHAVLFPSVEHTLKQESFPGTNNVEKDSKNSVNEKDIVHKEDEDKHAELQEPDVQLQPVIKEEVRTDISTITAASPIEEPQEKKQSEQKSHIQTAPAEKSQPQEEYGEKLKTKLKTKIREAMRLAPDYKEVEVFMSKEQEMEDLDMQAEVVNSEELEEEVEEKMNEQKKADKEKKDKERPRHRKKLILQRAFFEKDVVANSTRAWEATKAFFHAKYKAAEFHLKAIEGSDVAALMRSGLQEEKLASRSVKGIERDGSLDAYIGTIEGVSGMSSEKLHDVVKTAEEKNTATNLTTSPGKELVDASEIEKVHNGKNIFDAWMDGERVKVLMKSKGKEKPQFYIVRSEE